MTQPLVIDTHTSARAVLGMACRRKGKRSGAGPVGSRQWFIGPRVILDYFAGSGGNTGWFVTIQPDAYTNSTLYFDQRITRSRAAELLRSAGLDMGWYRRPTVLPRHALCSRS